MNLNVMNLDVMNLNVMNLGTANPDTVNLSTAYPCTMNPGTRILLSRHLRVCREIFMRGISAYEILSS